MDLQKSIDQMESKAADYTRAANALRALLPEQGSAPVKTAPSSSTGAKRGRPRATESAPSTQSVGPNAIVAKKSNTKPGKRSMSPEARAKIGAAMRARHQARRAAAT